MRALMVASGTPLPWDSNAQSKNKLYDPYVKAFRWAMDKIGDEGIVAFITNNSFIDAQMFDGMRKHLSEEFDTLYILDLGGNIRKGQSGDSNVFGIQVGVSINILVKLRQNGSGYPPRIRYNDETADLRKERTFAFLEEKQHVGNLEWRELTPDKRHTWLTDGLHVDFDTFIPMGNKIAKTSESDVEGTLFKTYSLGVSTNRDAWVYNFNGTSLTENVQRMIKSYNAQTLEWVGTKNKSGVNLDDFVDPNPQTISWSENLKRKLRSGQLAEFTESKLRESLYRPFTKTNLFFDRVLNERVYVFPSIFPMPDTENENRIICVAGLGDRKGFGCLVANRISNLDLAFEKNQCFPFYTYNEDGTNRSENITDWTLGQFRTHYSDDTISKWDIFHYTYGLLHHARLSPKISGKP